MNINILLVGRTGNGKSTTGNSILGCRAFDSGRKSESVTIEIQKKEVIVNGNILTVVDTVGFADTNCQGHIDNYQLIKSQIHKALNLCPSGFHAIIFVMNVTERITDEERKAFECITTVLGKENFQKFGVLLFTHGIMYLKEHKDKPFLNWCKEQPDLHKHLIQTKNRAILFENKNRSNKEAFTFLDQEKKLFEIIEHLFDPKFSKAYTRVNFDEAAADRIHKEVEALKPEIEKKVETLCKNTDSKLKEIKKLGAENVLRNSKDLISELDNLVQDINRQDQNTGVLEQPKRQLDVCKRNIDCSIESAQKEISDREIERQKTDLEKEIKIRAKLEQRRQSLERQAQEQEWNSMIVNAGFRLGFEVLHFAWNYMANRQ